MSEFQPPFDDTVQLENMPVDFSDTSPIVNGRGDEVDEDGSTPEPHVEIQQSGITGDPSISAKRAYAIVAILLFINLLNYMDRFTIAGVLPDIQLYYGLGSSEDGLIQTAFILCYMVFSPIFGYLGDRFTRKYIMGAGIMLWSILTLSGSFVGKDYYWAFLLIRALVGIGEASYSTIAPTIIADMFVKAARTRMLMFFYFAIPVGSFFVALIIEAVSQYFWLFIIIRAMVGIGEASYSTIAPTIIADLFAKEKRTQMLMIFYFAIPVGSGLGFIVGANVAKAFGAWQWALRVTPVLGIICVLLIFIFVKEPKRGASEGGTNLHNTTYVADLKELAKNKTFVLSTFGFTCVAFVTGALALWAPTFMYQAIKAQGQDADEGNIAFIFGGITVAAGFIGVAMGAETSRRLKQKSQHADPLICAFGLLTCVPFLFFSLVLSEFHIPASWALIFFGETLLCLNWSIIADILLYVVIPTRRSTAEAVQILISHALGDAGSPYLIGVISDALAKNYDAPATSPAVQSTTLRYAFYLTPFICVLGGGLFLATALFIEKDRNKAQQQTHVSDENGDLSGIDNPNVDVLSHDVTVTVASPNRNNVM